MFSLINFIAVSTEKSSSLHTIILKETKQEQHFVFSSKYEEEIRYLLKH